MMKHATMTSGPLGAELINLFPDADGTIRVVEATKNAVIIQMIEAPQEDGTMEYRRIVSIECVDSAMLPVLQEQARAILAV